RPRRKSQPGERAGEYAIAQRRQQLLIDGPDAPLFELALRERAPARREDGGCGPGRDAKHGTLELIFEHVRVFRVTDRGFRTRAQTQLASCTTRHQRSPIGSAACRGKSDAVNKCLIALTGSNAGAILNVPPCLPTLTAREKK